MRCLERMDSWLAQTPAERSAGLRQAWERRLWARGRLLRFRDQGEAFSAVVEGVTAEGALLVRRQDGGLRQILTGEIVLR